MANVSKPIIFNAFKIQDDCNESLPFSVKLVPTENLEEGKGYLMLIPVDEESKYNYLRFSDESKLWAQMDDHLLIGVVYLGNGVFEAEEDQRITI